MAHIEKRTTKKGETRYRVQITLKGQPRVTETFGTRREAQLWAERTTEAMRQRVFKPGSEAEKHSVGDLIERYIQDKVAHMAAPAQYSSILYWWQDQLGRHTRLSQVTPAAIASARDRLARGQGLSGKVPCPSTVRRNLTVLGGAFSTATKEWFWLEDNPCTKVKRPTEPRGRVRFLDEEERNRLLATCEESRTDWLYGLVVTALCTGARQAELLNLKWDDIDLERGLGVIHHSKNGERRALAITGLAEKVLRERNRGREDRRFVFGNGHRRPAFPQAAWKKALIEAEIEDFRFHDVRHTFASYLAMSGATLAELAEALGHRSLMMVKRYAHLTEGHTANVVARMTERFMAV